jgi:hypothetical protein
VFLLDQVTDDFVVKILNMFPFNALPAILLLLRLQCQLNEELLKLFIAEVDAELFKTENKVQVRPMQLLFYIHYRNNISY